MMSASILKYVITSALCIASTHMIITENNSVVKRREVLKNDPPREPEYPVCGPGVKQSGSSVSNLNYSLLSKELKAQQIQCTLYQNANCLFFPEMDNLILNSHGNARDYEEPKLS